MVRALAGPHSTPEHPPRRGAHALHSTLLDLLAVGSCKTAFALTARELLAAVLPRTHPSLPDPCNGQLQLEMSRSTPLPHPDISTRSLTPHHLLALGCSLPLASQQAAKRRQCQQATRWPQSRTLAHALAWPAKSFVLKSVQLLVQTQLVLLTPSVENFVGPCLRVSGTTYAARSQGAGRQRFCVPIKVCVYICRARPQSSVCKR